jgi:hypothetical protein
MSDKKTVLPQENDQAVIDKAKDFWSKYGKITTIASVIVILLAGGWYGYNKFIKAPNVQKAADAIFKAEEYYRMDSINLALNGDGRNWGFLKVADKYGSTDAGNLANFYAGSCYLKLNENEKAIKYLKKFSSSSKPTQARAYKLIADAYGDMGNGKEALSYYKKAASHFEKEEGFAADALLMAAYMAHKVLNDNKTAIELYKEIKEKFPSQGQQADMYLAQLGVYSTNN